MKQRILTSKQLQRKNRPNVSEINLKTVPGSGASQESKRFMRLHVGLDWSSVLFEASESVCKATQKVWAKQNHCFYSKRGQEQRRNVVKLRIRSKKKISSFILDINWIKDSGLLLLHPIIFFFTFPYWEKWSHHNLNMIIRVVFGMAVTHKCRKHDVWCCE